MTSHGDSTHDRHESCHCTLWESASCTDSDNLTSRHRVPRSATRPWPPPPPPASYGRRPVDQVFSFRASSPRAVVSSQAAGSVFYDVVRPLDTEPSTALYSRISDSTRPRCSTASTAAIVQPYCYLDDTPDRAALPNVRENPRQSSVSLPRTSLATSTRPYYDIQTLDSHYRARLKLKKTRDDVQALAGTKMRRKFMSKSCPNIRLVNMFGSQPRRAAVLSTFGKSRPAVQYGCNTEDCCSVDLGFENSVYLGAGRELDLFSGETTTLPVSDSALGRELQGDRTRLTSHQSHPASYGTLQDTWPCSSRARAFLTSDRSEKPDSTRPNSAVCKPIITSRHHKVGDSGQETTVTDVNPGSSCERRITQWLIAGTAGLLLGSAVMLYMASCLHCSLPLSVIMALVSAMLTIIVCGLCRAARSCAAVTLPSMTTTTPGRLSLLLIITTLVVAGPVFNICLNLRTMSSSLACGVELGRNQTALMASSMDSLSSRLTTAVSGLQRSIRAAWNDLRPLDEGLMRLNGALYNGVIQLYGAHKTCKVYVDKALSACIASIQTARAQCDGVMDALGDVYLHARGVLDRLNPDRWAPPTVPLHQRQARVKSQQKTYSSTDWNKFISQDRDLCQPLNGLAVCQSLNSSDKICAPTGWAGDVIRKALNRTQAALSSLFESIELKLRQTSARDARHYHHRYEPPHGAAKNRSYESRRRRRRQRHDNELSAVVDAVEVCAQLACIVLPLVAALVVSHAAYINYRNYVVYEDRHLSSDWVWKDTGPRTTTKSRRSATKNASTATELCRAVDRSDAVFVAVLHLGFSVTCCIFDLSLYWLLVVVGRHTAPPPFDFTGADSVNTVTSGEGTIVAVLAEFLAILHAGHWFGFTDAGYMCSVHPVAPNYVSVAIVVVLYVFLFVFITIQSRVLSWQNRVVAYFYPEQEQRRRQFFAAVLTARSNRQLNTLDDEVAPVTAQKDVLRDLMCLGPTSWRPGTLLAVRRAPVPPVSDGGPRCVACGQPVSRRLRKARASTRHLSNDVEICPVCDCRLTPDDDVVFSNAAYCDVTSRVS